MNTFNRMKENFEKVFTREQAEVLSTAINDAYSDLVKTGDFNELKDIIKDLGVKVGALADAQKELAETQKRTENELHELVVDHKETRRQLGGIADTVGYGLDDKIIPFMPDRAGENCFKRGNISLHGGL